MIKSFIYKNKKVMIIAGVVVVVALATRKVYTMIKGKKAEKEMLQMHIEDMDNAETLKCKFMEEAIIASNVAAEEAYMESVKIKKDNKTEEKKVTEFAEELNNAFETEIDRELNNAKKFSEDLTVEEFIANVLTPEEIKAMEEELADNADLDFTKINKLNEDNSGRTMLDVIKELAEKAEKEKEEEIASGNLSSLEKEATLNLSDEEKQQMRNEQTELAKKKTSKERKIQRAHNNKKQS